MANQNFKVKKGLEVGTGVTISDGNVHISGILTATTFAGDGSGLTGVTAEGTGVSIRDEGNPVGTAATINFIGANVNAVQSGAITNVTISAGGLSNVVEDTTPQLGGNLDLNSKNISGTGNIDITGYAAVSGVATFSQNVTFESAASFGDNDKANFGAGNDLQIFHDGTSNIISDAVGAGISLVGNTKVVGVLTATSFSGSLATTDLTGTITNAQLAGSISNDKLAGSIADNKLASTFLKNVVEDTTPQLGGNLDVNSKDITGTGDINLTGVSTFRGAVNVGHGSTTTTTLRFLGDVNQNSYISQLGTGSLQIQAGGSGILVWADSASGQITLRNGTGGGVVNRLSTTSTGVSVTGTLAATAVTGDGSGLTDLTGASAGTYGASALTPIITVDSNGRITGIATVATSGSGEGSFNNVVEDSTPQLGGNLDLNGKTINGSGNLDYTGNLKVTGISTITGVAGFGTHITLPDHAQIQIGGATGGDLKIYHDGSHSRIIDSGTGSLISQASRFSVNSANDSETMIDAVENSYVKLYHNNALRIQTTVGGAVVSGMLTATSFVKTSGTSSQFLKADGSVDTSTYLTSFTETDPIVGAINGIVKANGSGTISAAVAGTDYLTPTGDGSGLTGIAGTAFSNIQASWLVTASGSSAYRFTGPGNDASDNNPDLYLVRGQRYRFTNNSGGSHPFQIRVSNGGSAYSTGVTNNGAASGNIDWNVQWDAPSKLFYQCTSHGAMVGNIYIVGGPQVISGIVTATGFSGSGASLTSLPSGQLTGALPAISGASLTGVNATTLDSIDSASFLRSDADDTYAGNLTFNGFIAPTGTNVARNLKLRGGTTASTDVGVSLFNGSNNWALQLYGHYNASTPSYGFLASNWGGWDLRKYVNGQLMLTVGGVSATAWHSANDGSGSGLDADTVDGIEGANFIRSDIADSAVGKINFNANETNNWDTIATASGSQGCLEVYNSGSGNDAFMTFHTGGDYAFYFGLDATTNDLSVGGWSMGANKYRVWHAGNDGAGSGLDADTLDGYQTSTGNGNNTIPVTNSSGYLIIDDWIRVGDSTGIYAPSGAHWYEDPTYGWFARGRGTSSSIRLQVSGGTAKGWWYADSSANQGFLSTGGSWMLKVTNTGDVTATGNVTAYSDIRIKENVRTVDDALEKVKSMRGVYFDRKDTGKASVGVIAQEMEEILPQVVETEDTRTEENPDALEDLKTVSYGNIVGVLIEAIKDQQKQIDELKAKLEEK